MVFNVHRHLRRMHLCGWSHNGPSMIDLMQKMHNGDFTFRQVFPNLQDPRLRCNVVS